ncbi:MAG: ferric reductase-like transmembrane domain-containing protein [Minisyncoccota bacterium]
MLQATKQIIEPFLVYSFRTHDTITAFLARHFFAVKRGILIVAHLALLGFLFPEVRKDFGEASANILLFILFLSPLSRLLRMRLLLQLMGLRRELGILMGYLATVHGVGYLLDPSWFDMFIEPYLGSNVFMMQPLFFFGIIAYILTLPLLLTSNNLALRFLGGKKWKWLHRSVYLLFVVAILHRFFVKSGDNYNTIALFEAGILILSYLLIIVLARRNFITPLRLFIQWFGTQYKEYTITRNVKYKDVA